MQLDVKSRFDIWISGTKVEYKCFKFPAGEIGFKILNLNKIKETVMNYKNIIVDFVIRIQSSDDILMLMMAVDSIRIFLGKGNNCIYTLRMPYVPYSRQDRVCERGESFSLKVFCSLINSINFDQVYISMPHSSVSTALLDCVHFNSIPEIMMNHAIGCFIKKHEMSAPVLVAPDAGCSKLVSNLNPGALEIIQAIKYRNPKDGSIMSSKIYGDVDGKDCIVVDDLCDGGATFLSLAKSLRENGAKRLLLVVYHGIFSKGFDELLEYYEVIWTTNSYRDFELTEQYKDKVFIQNVF